MMTPVRIPTLLRPSVGGADRIEAPGATVGDVLRAIATDHPRFAEIVFESDGTLKSYPAVFLGDRDVRHMRGVETRVDDLTEIVVLPAASGGGR